MATPSKEDHVLRLILECSPLKEWHFQEIVREAQVTKAVANKWLKKYVAQGLLRHQKKAGKFPSFTVGEGNATYHSLKRIHMLNQLHTCGLLPKLLSSQAKTIILFGSASRGDWYEESDIDLFVLGKVPEINRKAYEAELNKNIELHVFRNKEELKTIKTGLLQNVVNGYVIKGRIQDIVEVS